MTRSTVYCAYCMCHRDPTGGKRIFDRGGGYRFQCRPCRDMRDQPRDALQKLAEAERATRRAVASETMKQIQERKRKNEL